jgi:hypothetical protein
MVYIRLHILERNGYLLTSLLLGSLLVIGGCSAETATAVCVPGISWMCTAAENACHQTKDPQACAVAQRQEDMAGLGLAGGMGQLGASMQNSAATEAQSQRDVELYKIANPVPAEIPSPSLIPMKSPQPTYIVPMPNSPGFPGTDPGRPGFVEIPQ